MNFYIFVLVILFHNFCPTLSSNGDRSPFYQTCVKNCLTANCTKDAVSFTPEAAELQDGWSRLLGWGCRDECRYHCMWRTADYHQQRGYDTPKFHGKWPFKRLFGVQEPAAAFSSLLNLAAHLYMYSKIVGDSRFTVRDTPLLLFWHLFVAVCVHAWVWSAVFHARDTPFTEFMDYASALSMVMALFVAAVVRVFHKSRTTMCVMLLLTVVYFVQHVQYLYTGRIDYQYNMAVNVCVGVMGSMTWLAWSLARWCGCRWGGLGARPARYVWRVVAFTKLSGAALLLELMDFPPRRGWDAHALWHLATAPLPLLFYRFVIDDLEYMQTTSEKTDLKMA